MSRDKAAANRPTESPPISTDHNDSFEAPSPTRRRQSSRVRKSATRNSAASRSIGGVNCKSEQSFRQHFFLCHDELKLLWRCRECGARFSSIVDYATHSLVQRHHNDLADGRYSCHVCADDPRAQAGKHPCALCGKSFAALGGLAKHRRVCHGRGDSAAVVEGAVIVSCDFCDQLFHRKTDLALHRRYDHAGETRACGVCGFASANLFYHLRTNHLANGGARLACDKCPLTFQHAYSLARHERRRHSGRAAFRCDLCGHGAPDSYWMARHQSAHDRHVDEAGHYLPLPPYEMHDVRRAGVWLLKDRLAHVAAGPDEVGDCRCGRCEEEQTRRLGEVETNSKATDTFDLEYFIRSDY